MARTVTEHPRMEPGGLGYQLLLLCTWLRWPQVWTAVYAVAARCLLSEVSGAARAAGPERATPDRPGPGCWAPPRRRPGRCWPSRGNRREVAIRDSVLVGPLGAGGIGVLLSAETSSFDWPAVTTVLVALVVLTPAVDLVSARARAVLR